MKTLYRDICQWWSRVSLHRYPANACSIPAASGSSKNSCLIRICMGCYATEDLRLISFLPLRHHHVERPPPCWEATTMLGGHHHVEWPPPCWEAVNSKIVWQGFATMTNAFIFNFKLGRLDVLNSVPRPSHSPVYVHFHVHFQYQKWSMVARPRNNAMMC